MNGLHWELNRKKIKAITDIATLTRGFLDDVLVNFVQSALKITGRWYRDNAMSIQGGKSTANIFTRHYKIRILERMKDGGT